MRIEAVSIESADICHIVRGFRVLERVDVISDRPVALIDLHAGVEKNSVAVCEFASGEGGDVAHIIDLVRGGGRFVEEDAPDVDILVRCAPAIGPVLVGGDLGSKDGEILRCGADPIMVWAAIVS